MQLLFFSPQKRKRWKISGFVKAELVCSWGGGGVAVGATLVLQSKNKDSPPSYDFYFLFCIEDSDQDKVIIL